MNRRNFLIHGSTALAGLFVASSPLRVYADHHDGQQLPPLTPTMPFSNYHHYLTPTMPLNLILTNAQWRSITENIIKAMSINSTRQSHAVTI